MSVHVPTDEDYSVVMWSVNVSGKVKTVLKVLVGPFMRGKFQMSTPLFVFLRLPMGKRV